MRSGSDGEVVLHAADTCFEAHKGLQQAAILFGRNGPLQYGGPVRGHVQVNVLQAASEGRQGCHARQGILHRRRIRDVGGLEADPHLWADLFAIGLTGTESVAVLLSAIRPLHVAELAGLIRHGLLPGKPLSDETAGAIASPDEAPLADGRTQAAIGGIQLGLCHTASQTILTSGSLLASRVAHSGLTADSGRSAGAGGSSGAGLSARLTSALSWKPRLGLALGCKADGSEDRGNQ